MRNVQTLGFGWAKAKLGLCQPKKMIAVIFKIMVQGTIPLKPSMDN
jgi:hypothetical protein